MAQHFAYEHTPVYDNVFVNSQTRRRTKNNQKTHTENEQHCRASLPRDKDGGITRSFHRQPKEEYSPVRVSSQAKDLYPRPSRGLLA